MESKNRICEIDDGQNQQGRSFQLRKIVVKSLFLWLARILELC